MTWSLEGLSFVLIAVPIDLVLGKVLLVRVGVIFERCFFVVVVKVGIGVGD